MNVQSSAPIGSGPPSSVVIFPESYKVEELFGERIVGKREEEKKEESQSGGKGRDGMLPGGSVAYVCLDSSTGWLDAEWLAISLLA
jgi:hypothetical protein